MLLFTLFQLVKIHKGINKVVNNKKKIEIPSIPSVNLNLKLVTKKILLQIETHQ
jgi:hypothetical protein